ncbi:Hydrogenase maturation factor HypA [Methanolapillus ohkumae]|uniref:Hydrogenase maturation factor HypA n=2 Tax=Methanolapillus ohkumae TaxID=3028298 RepID=A0AA96V5T2_9EURY|nr:Hydrogenase maturation factor HypA [Methanosarcinaceae archaeon Am2]
MHEYSLAMDLMENVLFVAQENDAAIVNKISIKVGKLAHINPIQLEFCLQSIAEDTIAKDAVYVFEAVPPEIKCVCGFFGKAEESERISKSDVDILEYLISLKCPVCGKDAEAVGGRDLMIESIDID